MGNPDLIFIFNGQKVIIIQGQSWESKPNALEAAITLYYRWAEKEVEFIKNLTLADSKKSNAKISDYDIEDMKIYEYIS